MIATHAATYDGRTSMDILDSTGPLEDAVRRGLERLDGDKRVTYSIWAVPPVDQPQLRADPTWPHEYIQAAGSASALTIEVRRLEADGQYRQYVVGRDEADADDRPSITIRFGKRAAAARPNEVFDAREAGDIYWYYYQHDAVPDGYVLRELDLT